MGHAGLTQLVECQLPKLDVAGSNPVSRSIFRFTRQRLPALARFLFGAQAGPRIGGWFQRCFTGACKPPWRREPLAKNAAPDESDGSDRSI